MNERAIAVLVVGEAHEKMFQIGKQRWMNYAKRVKADFIKIEFTAGSLPYHPAWAKMPAMHDLLGKYKRVMYRDADMIIDDVASPDIFEVVPEDSFGAFFEGYCAERWSCSLAYALEMYQIKTERKYDGEYLNSGLMVASWIHRDLFILPDIMQNNFYEQGCLNARVFGYGVKVKQLDYKWNRMNIQDRICGEELHGSYIVHWAGSNDYDLVAKQMGEIQDKFKDKSTAKTRLYVCVGGGLGDAATCEPIFRYMIEYLYENDPNLEVSVYTFNDYRAVLKGIEKYPQVKFFDREEDMPQELVFANLKMTVPYREMYTHPHGGHAIRAFFPYADVHNQDYGALCMLMQSLHPRWMRQPIIPVDDKDRSEVYAMMTADPRDASVMDQGFPLVVVHPGIGWPSKTFPVEYWQEIIEKVSKFATVVIIGQVKVLDVKLPKNGNAIDLRNKGETRHRLALLSRAEMLISNDSAPIHMAAAYDNYILMIATCKRPELIMPFRKGRQDFKALAMWHKLTCEALSQKPTEMRVPSLADLIGDIDDYLPTTDFVLDHARTILETRSVYLSERAGWQEKKS